MRKPPIGKSLAEINPLLAKEWHPTRNGELTPNDVAIGSNKKVWWKCDKEDDHEWESIIADRHRRNTKCPCCSNRKIVLSNCLATTHPELAKEWHPIRNGDFTPSDVVFGSNKKVWWKCEKVLDHEWEARISDRGIKDSSCPLCSNRKVSLSNCLFTTHPELAKQWHPIKNGELTPNDVVVGSNKKVWWKCDKEDDHEWVAQIYTRLNSKCPMCSSGRMKKIVKSNCLATLDPKLSNEWHPTKNGDLTPFDVGQVSKEKVWWKCDKGADHEWEASIGSRFYNRGCPICTGRKVVVSNSLATTHPELAKEWHPTKNGNLTTFDVSIASKKRVWWKCDKGDDHEWKATVQNRTIGGKGGPTRCPICSRRKLVLSNSLATTHPELAKEWHPTKNGDLTPFDVLAGTSQKIWWKCDKGDDHEWSAVSTSRAFGFKTGCPYCTLTPQSKQELIITFELLKIFKDINPRGFKTRVNGKLWTIDIYIPELHLGIEFDGNYWHKDKRELDKLKTEQLNEEGFDVIRVREAPLEKIFDTDVISSLPYNGKKVTNDVLRQIMNMKIFSQNKLRQIHNYLVKDKLQNEKGLNKYIDMILTQKGNK